MLDISIIRENSKQIQDALAKRGITIDFSPVLRLESEKRMLQTRTEEQKAERNRVSKLIGKNPDKELIADMQKLGKEITANDAKIMQFETKIFEFMSGIPNTPLPEVLAGGKEKNYAVKTFLEKPKFDFKPKDHV